MEGQALDIGPWHLALGLLFIALAQGCSLAFRLGLVKDLTIGAIRTFGQLFIMGYLLTLVFRVDMFLVTIVVFIVMIAMAVRTISDRVKEKRVPYRMPAFVSMLASYSLVSILVTGVIIDADPWWKPQYFIPIAGMIAGNSMNALSISLERLFSELKSRRVEVETLLNLGADYKEASEEITRNAVRAGMIPSINSMMAVGIVFLPGMMTGQILAGVDPIKAIKYQIVVMLMLAASAALGTAIVVLMSRRLCFGPGQRLLLRPGE